MQGTPFGRFQLYERLAVGGMGEVFVAVQTGMGEFRKPLALKLLLPDLTNDPEHVRLFLSEARLAARLQHPNVVQVFDAGEVDGRYFLTMELIDGVSLSTLIDHLAHAGQQVPPEVLAHVARQALEGLHSAHTARGEDGKSLELVHRDVSPSNILVSRRGEVKLADFGIATARGADTQAGTLRGKLEYLAPELFEGARATASTDLYALGVTLHRFAALRSPFEGDDLLGPKRVLGPRLSELRPDLGELAGAVTRAFAADPRERFASAAEMREAIPRGDFEARQEALRALVEAAEQTSGRAAAPRGAARPPTLDIDAPAPTEAVSQVFAPEPKTQLTAMHSPPGATLVPTFDELDDAPVTEPGHRRRAPIATAGLALLLALLVWWGLRSPAPEPVVELPLSAAEARQPGAAPPAPVAPDAPAPAPVEPPPEAEPKAEVPELPAPSPKATHPAPRPKPKATEPKVARAEPPSKLDSPAHLTVQAEPWANVEIDGRVVGQTPMADFPIERPRVVVRLLNPGYRTIQLTVELKSGETVKLMKTLVPR